MIHNKRCNMCGKEFDDFDHRLHFGYHDRAGYGSKYDGTLFDLNLCCDCFDNLIDAIVSNGAINPMVNEEGR